MIFFIPFLTCIFATEVSWGFCCLDSHFLIKYLHLISTVREIERIKFFDQETFVHNFKGHEPFCAIRSFSFVEINESWMYLYLYPNYNNFN